MKRGYQQRNVGRKKKRMEMDGLADAEDTTRRDATHRPIFGDRNYGTLGNRAIAG